MIIQFCGLSGSGKTTLAYNAKEYFKNKKIDVEVLDGDEYRKVLSSDLGFSKEHRNINIRRLAFVASRFSRYNIIPIICAINPYESIRKEMAASYPAVKTVFIKCSIDELVRRDTKGMYARAFLPDGHPDKVHNLSGINDPFEEPENADLVITTDSEAVLQSTEKLVKFIESNNPA